MGSDRIDLLVDDPEEERSAPHGHPVAVHTWSSAHRSGSNRISDVGRGAERAAQEDLVAGGHVGVVRVGLSRPVVAAWGCGWACRCADKEPERERMAVDAFVASDEFRGREDVGEALRLLEREHAERKTPPRGDALALAAETVVERSGEDEKEIGLCLAAAGREPERVDDASLARSRVVENRVALASTKPSWNGRHSV